MRQAFGIRSLLVICGGALGAFAWSQSSTPHTAPVSHATNPAPDLIHQMVGVWDVRQQMWSGQNTVPLNLPDAIAHRSLVGESILEERMNLSPDSKSDPFTRIAYFDYNQVTSQYEYFSVDTRAPQMMNERSFEAGPYSGAEQQGPIVLWGGMFVAPKWGDFTNVAFRYRLVVGPILQNRQVVQLYLTPVTGNSFKEFLAFEYVYSRKP